MSFWLDLLRTSESQQCSVLHHCFIWNKWLPLLFFCVCLGRSSGTSINRARGKSPVKRNTSSARPALSASTSASSVIGHSPGPGCAIPSNASTTTPAPATTTAGRVINSESRGHKGGRAKGGPANSISGSTKAIKLLTSTQSLRGSETWTREEQKRIVVIKRGVPLFNLFYLPGLPNIWLLSPSLHWIAIDLFFSEYRKAAAVLKTCAWFCQKWEGYCKHIL